MEAPHGVGSVEVPEVRPLRGKGCKVLLGGSPKPHSGPLPLGPAPGTYSVVPQHIEDMAQEHKGAGCETVQVLCVGHLQSFSKKPPT